MNHAGSNSDRGYIVICFASDDDTRLVKRVIGVPGDEIKMRNLRVLINGVPLEDGPLMDEVTAGMGSVTFRDQKPRLALP